MKIYYLIFFTFLLLVSCNDIDEEKYKFVKEVINNPDKFDSVIRSSNYYYKPFFEKNYYTIKKNGERDSVNQFSFKKKMIIESFQILRDEGFFIDDAQYIPLRTKNKFQLKYWLTLQSNKSNRKVDFVFVTRNFFDSREDIIKKSEDKTANLEWDLTGITPY